MRLFYYSDLNGRAGWFEGPAAFRKHFKLSADTIAIRCAHPGIEPPPGYSKAGHLANDAATPSAATLPEGTERERFDWMHKKMLAELPPDERERVQSDLGEQTVFAVAVQARLRAATSPKCECGGALRFYDGLLGYEAMVCDTCGEHWNATTPEDHARHVERYRAGHRTGKVFRPKS